MSRKIMVWFLTLFKASANICQRFPCLNPRIASSSRIPPSQTSQWRLLSPRRPGLCRWQSTAVQSSLNRTFFPEVLFGRNKSLRLPSNGGDGDGQTTVPPKQEKSRKSAKATSKSKPTLKSKLSPKSKAKSASRSVSSFKGKKSKKSKKARSPTLSAAEHDKFDLVKTEIYNFCATSLAIPKFENTESSDGYKVRISCIAKNIDVEWSGAKAIAEYQACLKFKAAIEEQEPIPSVLTSSNTSEFFIYYKSRQQSGYIDNKQTEPQTIGAFTYHRAQVQCDGQPVGDATVMRSKKDAIALASLTAAIHLANRHPSILNDFKHAERGNDGVILSSLRPVDLNVDPDMLADMARASGRFLLSANMKQEDSPVERSWETTYTKRIAPEISKHRSSKLFERHQEFLMNPRLEKLRDLKAGLPMNQRREEILELVNNNTFSIVVGATGSGKTTQVPQIILEKAIVDKRGAEVDIICTQPRRIAAQSVATRVAEERNEPLGNTVGYHVKGAKKVANESGRMTFCTTGILLKQLQTDPDHIMDTVSHIIIDEVHERDILIDFLMITLKKLVEVRHRENKRVPKMVLMSATMDTELFSNYYKQPDANGILQSCPSISVPGRTFPVKEKYLETILDEFKQSYSPRELQLLSQRDTQEYLETEGRLDVAPVEDDMKDAMVPTSLAAATVAHICRTTSEGAILVFLPGLKEILNVEKALLQNPLGVDFSNTSKYQIFKLHSNLRGDDEKIFDPVAAGCRKIIISTNIAETSVTIPDVQHVVDSGKLREKRYNQLIQITKLQCVWLSKSNMRQRAGRAGRVQNGNYYALYPSSRFKSLETIGLPEMLRSDLMEICLDVKAHTDYKIGDFLAGSIQPPHPAAVEASVQDLKDIEALTEKEELTPLGRILASLPVHPSLGKMIILGVIFRCLDPLLILGAATNERSLFARPLGLTKIADEEKEKFGKGKYSDPLATINAFREARDHLTSTRQLFVRYVPDYINQRYLHYGAFKTIHRTIWEIEQLLESIGVIPHTPEEDRVLYQSGHPLLNQNSGNDELVRALILAGQRGNVAVSTSPSGKLFSTQRETRAMIHRSSLNSFIGEKAPKDVFATSKLPQPPIISFGSRSFNDQNDITLRETSLVSPLIATLFGGELKSNGRNLLQVGDRLQFYVKSNSTSLIKRDPSSVIVQFRRGIDAMLSTALADLAKDKNLADNPGRDAFAHAVAHIMKEDFKMYMGKAGMTGAQSSLQRFAGNDAGRTRGFSQKSSASAPPSRSSYGGQSSRERRFNV